MPTPSRKTPSAATKRPAAATAKAAQPTARFRMRVAAGGVNAIGPGKIDLLEAIRATGSITSAAKSLDMSYRRAWLLMDELNRSLREPALASAKGGQSGGGSELTALGIELIETYRRIEATAARACATDIKRLVGMVVP